ncbi:MAG: hypothetical protein CMO55_21285 [Verrucomicrobiales bacterium]|nr:hypothetical protein [Verrucomicrobiales bacterium]
MKMIVAIRVEILKGIPEGGVLSDEKDCFILSDLSVPILVESIKMLVFRTGRGHLGSVPFFFRDVVVPVQIELREGFLVFIAGNLTRRQFSVRIRVGFCKTGLIEGRWLLVFVFQRSTARKSKGESCCDKKKCNSGQRHDARNKRMLYHGLNCRSMAETIMKRFILLLLSLCSALALSEDKPDRTKVLPMMTEGIIMEGSSVFTYVDEKKRRRLTADVYRPEADGPHPAIVMYFGGGWQNGRPGLFAPLGQALAQRGYVCVIPEYRLSGEAPFPAAAHDAKAAIRWIRKYAKRYHVDPNRIACIGGSAGGHLSGFMAATNGKEEFEGEGEHKDTSSDVQAAIVMCGPMNLLEENIVQRVEEAVGKPEGDAILDFMGGAVPSVNNEIYKAASPLTHVSKRTPPMLFIDGENDRPKVRYTEFWEKMDELQIPHEFVLMPKGPHPFWVMKEWFDPTVEAVDAFLQKHL